MCAANSRSLEVAYGHLAEMQPMLAVWLTDVPRDMLQILDEVLQSVVLAEFPHYKQVCGFPKSAPVSATSPKTLK
jgi:DNA replicative helicase MCM subunit Mcm2 (Cdc46/Mcm family)